MFMMPEKGVDSAPSCGENAVVKAARRSECQNLAKVRRPTSVGARQPQGPRGVRYSLTAPVGVGRLFCALRECALRAEAIVMSHRQTLREKLVEAQDVLCEFQGDHGTWFYGSEIPDNPRPIENSYDPERAHRHPTANEKTRLRFEVRLWSSINWTSGDPVAELERELRKIAGFFSAEADELRRAGRGRSARVASTARVKTPRQRTRATSHAAAKRS